MPPAVLLSTAEGNACGVRARGVSKTNKPHRASSQPVLATTMHTTHIPLPATQARTHPLACLHYGSAMLFMAWWRVHREAES